MLQLPAMIAHAAVCVKNHIIVFGGHEKNYTALDKIYMYNMCTQNSGGSM